MVTIIIITIIITIITIITIIIMKLGNWSPRARPEHRADALSLLSKDVLAVCRGLCAMMYLGNPNDYSGNSPDPDVHHPHGRGEQRAIRNPKPLNSEP